MSTTAQRVRDLVAPLIGDGVTLYDVEHNGSTLRILLDREGGIDVAALAEATRRISSALDEEDPIGSSYTLEVSSPGLERPLRTPEHFAAAVGRDVKVKCRPGTEGDRRVQGRLVEADDHSVIVETPTGERRSVRLDQISRANIAVDWSPPPKPGSPGARRRDRDSPRSTQSEAQS